MESAWMSKGQSGHARILESDDLAGEREGREERWWVVARGDGGRPHGGGAREAAPFRR